METGHVFKGFAEWGPHLLDAEGHVKRAGAVRGKGGRGAQLSFYPPEEKGLETTFTGSLNSPSHSPGQVEIRGPA